MNKFVKVIGGILGSIAIAGGLYINSQREALIEDAITKVEEKASKFIGTPIKIGKVDVDEVNWSELQGSSITVHDIEIFDKNSEYIATADAVKISFKLLGLYDDGAGAIDEIDVTGAKVNLKKRADNSWNVEDITIKSEGESNFGAKITVANSAVDAEFDGKNISVTDISATADCTDLNAIDLQVDSKVLGSRVNANGIVGLDNQVVTARIDTVDVEKVLPYLPEGTLPESLTINRGTLNAPKIYLSRRGDVLTYLAESKVQNGAVTLEDTNIGDINGNVTLNEKEVWFDASAMANGQQATASGKIRMDTDEPFFDIYAESESFSPAAIIPNIGVQGAASFTAHLTGTTKRPHVEADIFSPFAAYDNFSASNLSFHLNYGDDMIYLTDVRGETFGGSLAGDVEISTPNLKYNAHVKAESVDAANLLNFAGSDVDLNAKISADVALNGEGSDLSKLKLYGSAHTSRADYGGFHINDAKTSFYYDNKVLKIDNFNAVLPNHGGVGFEGTIADGSTLDLNFYASHVDLSRLRNFDEKIDVSGLADLSGKVYGKVDKPQIDFKLSAVDDASHGENLKGLLFKQPYDSIKLYATGGLDAVNVNDFTLEKDGKIIWKMLGGTVELTGDKKIDLELSTANARVEDIVALVAPDQDITGDITNKVKVTGTIDNPNVVGNVNIHYGSYHGILISGMNGDYFYEGDKLRLQNFYVTSPMADMILDGTFDKNTGALDFVVQGQDISLKRFKSQFPEDYYAEGHGTFEGVLQGTVDMPHFDGKFISPELNLNGVDLTDVHGQVEVIGPQVIFNDFRFNQGDGNFKMDLNFNSVTKNVNGKLSLQNADIPALMTLANKKALPVTGKLDSEISISGSLRDIYFKITGNIPQGTIGGHDIHDVALEITADDIIHFNKLRGAQGEKGEFNLTGTMDQDGVLDLNLISHDLELAMFSGAAGLDLDVTGTTNINAKVSGTAFNPEMEATLTAEGSVGGAAFDLLQSKVTFKDWVFDINELFIQREIAGKLYKASAAGKIPVKALYINPGENILPNEQINVNLSLNDADLSLLPVVSKAIDWAAGDLDGNISITGTAVAPKVNGKIILNDGTVKMKYMSSPIEHINIATVFKDDRFDIEKFTGNIGKGNFNLNGGFNFANFALNEYNFNLKADALDIRSDFFTGPLNAEFTVSEVDFFNGPLPKVEGHLDLDKCTISVPVIPDSDDPLPRILLDVAINLGEKVHLYSSHLYDMYLTGTAHFEGSTRHPKQSGSIKVKRGGTLTYINSVFDIKEGEASFNQMDSFFPSINFYAETKISRTKVFLYLNGSLNNMKVKLGSSPEMTETEIIQVLTLRERYEKGGNMQFNSSDVLEIGLQMSVLGDIEDAVRRTLGFDQFRVTRGTGSAFDTNDNDKNKSEYEFNVFIGKYISDRIMLRYTQGVTGDRITRYGFQYDINDNIGIIVEREDGKMIYGLEAKFNF